MHGNGVMAIPASVADLRQYIQVVQSFPKLDADEERRLAERYRRDNDIDAAWRLVTAHLRYVVHIARGYTGYGLLFDDLVQEGNIGLMKAVRRFDPSRGVRLLPYAAHWIRAQINDFVLKNWRIVKLATTKAKRKLFYKLRSTKTRLDWLTNAEAERVAEDLDVEADDVREMEARLYLPDESFDPAPGGADEDHFAPADYLGDASADPAALLAEAEIEQRAPEALRTALSTLDERSREILERRWLVDDRERLTLQELGERLGVSAERVRQLEANAIERLRALLAPRLAA